MYEQFMGEYTDRDSASRQVQLFTVIYKLREFSSNQPSLHLFSFSTYSGIKNSLPYPKHMLRAHYISMNLATAWECSLNQFSTSLFVSLFVNREPQQIFMGEKTEYRANLVHARVNFPVTLLHIFWVCQYKLFLIPYQTICILKLILKYLKCIFSI